MVLYRSPYPDLTIPKVSVYDLLFSSPKPASSSPLTDVTASESGPVDSASWETRDLFIDAGNGTAYTWRDAKKRIEELARALRNVGRDSRIPWSLREDEVVGTFSPNHIDFPIVVWGTLRAGMVMTAANPAYTVGELEHQLSDSKTRILVTSPANLPLAAETAARVGIPVANIVLMDSRTEDERKKGGVDRHYADFQGTRLWTVEGLVHVGRSLAPLPAITYGNEIVNKTCYLMYSSGTTGRSKGVEQTNGNIVANCLQIQASEKYFIPVGKRMLAVLPMYHCYSLTWCVHFSVFQGAPLVVMPGFNLAALLHTLSHYQIHFAHLVPPIMVQLAKMPLEELRKYDLTHLRWIASGAAPMGAETGDEVMRRLPRARIKQGYGMTELAPVSIVERYGPPEDDGTGCIGVLLPNQVARLVDLEGKDVGPGEEGELLIKGPNVMKGYLNRPDATAETFDGDFLKTGDLAVVDEQGRFFIRDRLKELIKVKGFQVPPAELEALLLTHPVVADCAVISIPDVDGTAGELPKAFVVLRENVADQGKMAAEIQAFVAGKVAHYKRLTGGVDFVDVIPKSASGKILRRILKDNDAAKRQSSKAKL